MEVRFGGSLGRWAWDKEFKRCRVSHFLDSGDDNLDVKSIHHFPSINTIFISLVLVMLFNLVWAC